MLAKVVRKGHNLERKFKQNKEVIKIGCYRRKLTKGYRYYYSGQYYPATYKFHLTHVTGKYTVKAILFDEQPRTKIVEFEVLPNPVKLDTNVHIDAETRVNQRSIVEFNAISSMQEGVIFSWDFDSGGGSRDHLARCR